jgi:hypothetical protein
MFRTFAKTRIRLLTTQRVPAGKGDECNAEHPPVADQEIVKIDVMEQNVKDKRRNCAPRFGEGVAVFGWY